MASSDGAMCTSERRNVFSNLPIDLLVGQLRACAAVDLAALAATAKQPRPCEDIAEDEACLTLSAYVARGELSEIASHWKDLPPGHWVRLYHFLRCARVACSDHGTRTLKCDSSRGRSTLVGHLCAAETKFVRCGVGRCEVPGEELEVDVALIAPLQAWRQRLGSAGAGGCQALPLPDKWSIHAHHQLEAVAPVTNYGQVCAVVPLRWGNGEQLARKVSFIQQLAEPLVGNASSPELTTVARILNKKGDCGVVRTHRMKIHFLSRAQIRMVARSDLQPLLANALANFSGCDACLWAIVYTEDEAGFFCFG